VSGQIQLLRFVPEPEPEPGGTVSGTFFHYSAPQRFGDLMASGAE